MKKMKLAIMGASAVGKTIFLTSFFYSKLRQKKGKYPVKMSNEASKKEVDKLIGELFDQHKLPEGTEKIADLSFYVKKLGLAIETHDIPGGWTTDVDQWARQKVLPSLKEADGVIFFVSAEDLINDPAKLIQDNMAFTEAVSKLRESADGKKARADVPIWFVFTKSDCVPQASAKDLMKKIPMLLKAGSSKTEGNWLFKKGAHVRGWRTSSLGTWEDRTKVPDTEHYKPENVVESMESLFRAMLLARKEHSTRKRIVAVALAAAAYCACVGGVYMAEVGRWEKVQSDVERSVESLKFAEAQQALSEYVHRSKWPFFIQPPFLHVGDTAAEMLAELAKKDEVYAYEQIRADVETVDMTQVPVGDAALLQSRRAHVEEYLKKRDFELAAPEHWKKAVAALEYYAAGEFLLTIRGAKPETDFAGQLAWQLEGLAKIKGPIRDAAEKEIVVGLLRWTAAHREKADSARYLARVREIEAVEKTPGLTAEMKKLLADDKTACRTAERDWWQKETDSWLAQAQKLAPEKSLQLLAQKLKVPNLPAELAEKIRSQHYQYYDRMTTDWLSASLSEDALRQRLNAWPDLPQPLKNRVNQKIESIVAAQMNTHRSRLSKAGNLNALDAACREAAAFLNKHEQYRAAWYEQAGALIEKIEVAQINSWQNTVNNMVRQNRLRDAANWTRSNVSVPYVSEALSRLPRFAAFKNKVESTRSALLEDVELAHFAYCKKVFAGATNVKNVSDALDTFLSIWPTGWRREDVRKVQNYVRAVQRGLPMRFVITGGWFQYEPDVYIKVEINYEDVGTTDTVFGKRRPTFEKNTVRKTWYPGMRITLKAYDWHFFSSDKLILHVSKRSTGLKGWQQFNTTFKDGVNEVYTSVYVDAPACPW